MDMNNRENESTVKQSNNNRSVQIRRLLGFIVVILALVISFVNISQAWIRRSWTPSLSQNNINIEASGALTFRLASGSSALDSITLNQYMENTDDFVLKPVSNISGKSEDFFTLDRSNPDNMKYVHISQSAEGWTKVGEDKGYIEVTFYILGKDHESQTQDDYTKWIFLNKESTIKLSGDDNPSGVDASQAVRASITVGDRSTGITYILTPNNDQNVARQHSAINNVKSDGQWLANGLPYENYKLETDIIPSSGEPIIKRIDGYDDNLDDGNTANKVFTLAHFNGGFEESDYENGILIKETFDESNSRRCLFQLAPNESRTITVRVWLEGTDPLCTDLIAGLQIDLLLRFDSVDVKDGRIIQVSAPVGSDATTSEAETEAQSEPTT